MLLLKRRFAAVALDIGLGHGKRQVVFLDVIVKLAHALEIPRPFSLVEPMRNYMESKQGVRADFLDQNNQSSPERSRGLNQLAAPQKIGSRFRKLKVKA